MKIAVILGTRPEIIKLSPIIRGLEMEKINFFILHTGQHYSFKMDKIFFQELKLPPPKYNLEIGIKLKENPDACPIHGQQTGMMLTKIEQILIKEKPDVVLLQGDTNTVLAGVLAAAKLHIKIGHVEAGLRSYDNFMPEEINRIIADRVSDFLFCPTITQKEILFKEGIPSERIFVTGNTIVDAISQNIGLITTKDNILTDLALEKKSFFLLTLHREETVEQKERLKGILTGLELVHQEYKLPVICPMHPRTKHKFSVFQLTTPDYLKIIEPLGYLDFLRLMQNAKVILTDSGGIQEESCILQIPLVTLRNNTERPETLIAGGNILSSYTPEKIFESVKKIITKVNWPNPFGDGTASNQIIEILKNAI